jgi:hypothetical protein
MTDHLLFKILDTVYKEFYIPKTKIVSRLSLKKSLSHLYSVLRERGEG